MPLSFADKNKPYTIRKVTGRDAVRTHLHNLGFTESETVSVIQSLDGNLIVEIRGVRIALDAGLAKRILV